MPEKTAAAAEAVPAGTQPPRVTASAAPFAGARADLAVCFAFEKDRTPSIPGLSAAGALPKTLARVMRGESFRGKRKEIILWHAAGRFAAERYLIVGLGRRADFGPDALRDGCGLAARRAIAVKARRMALVLPDGAAGGEAGSGTGSDSRAAAAAEAATEGLALGAYKLAKYLTQDDGRPASLRSADLLVPKGALKAAQQGAARGALRAEAVNLVRDIVNEPAMVVTPARMAQVAHAIAKERGLEIRVYEKKDLERLGMGAILGVSAGSHQPPCLIHLIHKPAGAPVARVALVGKGLTFDSGGLSLKTASGMETMKLDKAGATVVLAAMGALPRMAIPLEVHGILGMTENMPGGAALKPGDVLRTMSGKSIEVLNTDAEGRLVLADALEFAQRQKPDQIIDLATLTGACMVALGPIVTGVFGTDQPMVDGLIAAGRRAGEKLWQLPLCEEYRDMIRSEIADVKNSPSSRYGGAITAALFLKNFVEKGARWVHLDIAGPAFAETEQGYMRKGATGAPVRTILNYLEALAAAPGG